MAAAPPSSRTSAGSCSGCSSRVCSPAHHCGPCRKRPDGPAHQPKEHIVSNDELRFDVEEELLWEPRVDNEAIAVSTDDGDVTLRGTVGSFHEKRAAANAAKRVYGVTTVDNELSVRLLDGDRRDDADVRGGVLQALMLDAAVPSSIDASVTDGIVTLTGMAPFNYQRAEAEFVAGNVPGVIGLDDQVELTIADPTPGDVRQSIKKAFKRDASLDAEPLSIDALDGRVALSGHVASWVEHDAAVNAAWAAPGVRAVEDGIVVDY